MRVCDAARMNAYSKDLRVKVVDAVDRGIPRKEVTRIFGISLPTIERYLRRRRQTEDLTPKPSPGRTPTIGATIEQRRALWEQLESNSALPPWSATASYGSASIGRRFPSPR